MTVFHPQGSRVLIEPAKVSDRTAGGIIIPEIARHPARGVLKTGIVVAMGPGVIIERGPRMGERRPMPDGSLLPDVRGKTVYYYAGEGIATSIRIEDEDGESIEHDIVRADNLDAYVNDEGELVPLGDRVIIRRDRPRTQTLGGLFLPPSSVEEPAEGVIVAVGSGKIKFTGVIKEPDVVIGQHVMFGKYAGTALKRGLDELVVIREEEIMCVSEELAVDSGGLERTLLDSEPAAGGP